MVIAEALCILTRKRNDRSPYIALVVRYFVHCGLHHRHLPACVPKPMLSNLFHSGTVCDVVYKVLALIEVERIYLFCLLYEF